jgi:hypothetical protein
MGTCAIGLMVAVLEAKVNFLPFICRCRNQPITEMVLSVLIIKEPPPGTDRAGGVLDIGLGLAAIHRKEPVNVRTVKLCAGCGDGNGVAAVAECWKSPMDICGMG